MDSPWDAGGPPGTRFSFTVRNVVFCEPAPLSPSSSSSTASPSYSPEPASSPSSSSSARAAAAAQEDQAPGGVPGAALALSSGGGGGGGGLHEQPQLSTRQHGLLNVLLVEDDKLNCMIMDTKVK